MHRIRKKLIYYLPAFIGLFITTFAMAEMTPAFPGAEGFGRYTTGGRGGAVYHVTSLADDASAGTLRWALNKGGKRTVVFDVSGTVHLTSSLGLSSGNVTVSGQTAPGNGICVADYPFTINASNVIIRFIRFRLGNINVAYHEGDGLGGMDQQNIIVDHCSVSWSIDECCSVYGNKNQTIQWCIVSQSLRNAGHVKGAHGYGGNWGGSGASFHHNLMAHHDSRTPRLGPRPGTQTDERMDMRNNVIYNWAGNGCYGGEGMNVNMVNNYYKPGPGTKQKSAAIQYRIAGIGIRTTSYVATYPAFAPMLHAWGKFFVDGNYIYGNTTVTADNWTKGIYEQISNSSNDYTFTQATKDTMKLAVPIDYLYTTTHTPSVAYEKVLSYAGASLSRDWVDSLMVYDTRNGVASHTGAGSGNVYGIIDTQEDNKPANAPADWNAWPVLKNTPAPADTDGDGMPDNWETANGLNPNNALDGSLLDKDGFTMLELYLNSIVSTIVNAQNEGGTPTGSIIQGSAAGSEQCIKYSSGVKFTLNIPSGTQVDTVKFVGYDNYSVSRSQATQGLNKGLYIIEGQKIVWSYTHAAPKGEISDAVMLSNGNILFAHQFGITEITKDKKVVWNYDAPEGTEIHTAQPIGNDKVLFLQNGDPTKLIVMNKQTNAVVKELLIPVGNPSKIHSHFRHARLTKAGTILVAHLDMGKLCEYDSNGKQLMNIDVPGIWSAEELANGNILITSSKVVREINRKLETVWEYPLSEASGYALTSPQTSVRLKNGNTLVNNWFNQWNGTGQVDMTNQPVQMVEVTPDKKIVWALREWTEPTNLGPSTIFIPLSEPRTSENVCFGEFH